MLSLLKRLLRPWLRVVFSLEYRGLENIPHSGPVIIAGNHPSYLDPVLVALPVERPIRYMAWDALFKVPLLGQVIKALGAFPVDITRGRGEDAFHEALRVLESGDALGIFPEGQRSERGPMGELRTGTARLAVDTGAPIVPVTIGGANRAWPKWRLLPKPAKIVVRFHAPIQLDQKERLERRHDREYLNQVMGQVAASINRSLKPSLREAEGLERWYQQPPAHIRSYEWAPLAAAVIATIVAGYRQTLAAGWMAIWLPLLAYYGYLVADLVIIKPGRTAKWLRNSMPLWLILGWHVLLTRSIEVPSGEWNGILVAAVLLAFFPFFWEDYYTLQKFVRGLVVAYYVSLALLLRWPSHLGTLVAVLVFVAAFSVRERIVAYKAVAAAMVVAMSAAILLSRTPDRSLIYFAALGLLTLAYVGTFMTVAYDIRKAGQFTAPL
jgi:1-acyl-sn-glycerol-3-phosphate acyltransferase